MMLILSYLTFYLNLSIVLVLIFQAKPEHMPSWLTGIPPGANLGLHAVTACLIHERKVRNIRADSLSTCVGYMRATDKRITTH